MVYLVLLCAQGLSQAGYYSGPDSRSVERAGRNSGVPALEAYPLDGDLTSSSSFTGFASTFLKLGFKPVVRRVPPRPIMRHTLER
jgi:hypothetical protein